ncbi:hypothetical protein GO730_35465 [Spirosoma sp. HMF3257]|uniref:Uncharacterized protein n=1 Tax=Spirosoma telluris TaxID=2183553 RepID=A0A327NRT5_9BACT|nr:hypothetical protein [Spirosoma telluris]RAI78060.1 hypothetical protein HMF3257_35370 [Spirosoma telluris]
MEAHVNLSDDQFEQQFKSCQLDPALFSHEAHLRLAWIHVKKYGVEQAVENICDQLVCFVDSLGAKDKYNKTLTIAAIRAVNHFINKSDTDNFQDFIRQFPRLNSNFKELIACHYQLDIYTSDLAKAVYVEPDLLPFS